MGTIVFNNRFEWDEEKAQANLEKHRISFEVASELFSSEKAVRYRSTQQHHGELREILVGSLEGIFLLVVFVTRGERIRVISARKAHRDEVKKYYEFIEKRAVRDPSEDEG